MVIYVVIALVGPTGVGKTKISEELSIRLGREIINCDATQVYKELNIGSAKPKKEEMSNKKHHLFDFVEITDDYNAFNYQQDLRKLLDKSTNYIIVGGTGLYLKAGLYDYTFKNKNLSRDKLEKEENTLLYPTIFIGLKTGRETLYERINKRVDIMLDEGLLDEVESLYKHKDTSRILNSAIGYKEIISYLDKEITKEEAIELVKKNSRKYAKRQFTWFNNKMNIEWFDVDLNNIDKTIDEILKYIKTKI